MNYPNRMAARCWNYTVITLFILTIFWFGGRIYVAFASRRVAQILHQAAPVASEEAR